MEGNPKFCTQTVESLVCAAEKIPYSRAGKDPSFKDSGEPSLGKVNNTELDGPMVMYSVQQFHVFLIIFSSVFTRVHQQLMFLC